MDQDISTIIQNLERQLDHRLDKLWKLFSWTSSIFIGIIGGLLVLIKNTEIKLHIPDRILISIVIAILSLYSYQWIKENLKFERIIRKQLESLFNDELKYSRIKEIEPHKAKYGYSNVVLLLGAVAFIITWLDLIYN